MKKKSLLSEVRQLQKIAGLLRENNQADAIKRELITLMVNDCIENFNGDFQEWLEHGMQSVIPPEILSTMHKLADVVGEDLVDDIIEDEIYPAVKEQLSKALKEFDLNADDDSYEQELAAAKAAVKGGTLIASADEGSQASPEGFLQYLKGEGKGKKFMYFYYEDGEEAGVVKVTPTEAYELVQAVEDPYKTKEIPERLPQPYNWELYAK